MFITRDVGASNGENRSGQLLTACIVCLVLSVIGIVLRCSVRKWHLHRFFLDDWLMLITFMLYVALVGVVLEMAYLGLGKHSKDLTGLELAHLFKFIYISEIFYNTVTLLVKIAFTFFYLRTLSDTMILGHSDKSLRYGKIFLWGLFVFLVIFGIILECLFIFQCSPISHTWTVFIGSKGHCLSEHTLVSATYFHSAVNGAIDLLLAFLPVPYFWKMDLQWKMKLSVIGVLCIGALASVATFVRFKYVKDLPQGSGTDPAWTFEPLVLWSLVEPALALFAAGLIVSKPLIHSMARLMRGRNYKPDPTLIISVVEEKTERVESSAEVGDVRYRQPSITGPKPTTN